MPAERPPLEADDTPIGRDWVEYANALEAELQAAQERERVLLEKVESFCRLEPRLAVVRTWQRSFREALAAQRTEEPSE